MHLGALVKFGSKLSCLNTTAMGSRTQYLLKLCHKSCFFTPESISQLHDSGAVDLPDFISLVFLMCGNDQIEEMYQLLSELDTSLKDVDFFEIFQRFPNWERKLLEALVRIKNLRAIGQLNMLAGIEHNVGKPTYCLSASRVILYRIFEDLGKRETEDLVRKLIESGAPKLERDFPNLELYFMFWHVKGFLDVDTLQRGFRDVAKCLKGVGKSELAGTLGWNAEMFYDEAVFVDDYPIELYPIQDAKNVGLCLIINQVKYGGKHCDRDSSLSDAAKLKSLMGSLNFSVVVIEDLCTSEFCDTIKAIVSNCFSESYSMFLLIVMAHGDRGGILCPDSEVEGSSQSEQLSTDEVKPSGEPMGIVRLDFVQTRDIQNCIFECDKLRGKPKIVIFNACRGKDTFSNLDYFKAELVADGIQPDLHSHVDIVTCYSTLPDFISYRDRTKGSLFINVFCDVLTKRPSIEVCELFTLMNARLMQPTPDLSNGFLPGKPGKERGLANPFNFTSSLSKKLYFKVPESLG